MVIKYEYLTVPPKSIPVTVLKKPFSLLVSPDIFRLRPDYRALSIRADDVRNAATHDASASTVAELPSGQPEWAEAHLESWRAAYRAFGAKPQRTLPSVDALMKRARSSGLPTINAVVDAYNAVSVRYALPIGGENVHAYEGAAQLRYAREGDLFDTVSDGVRVEESVPSTEVVWADDRGVTCRRWNWRQGLRTRIDLETTSMWFILERLDPMPMEKLYEAGEMLMLNLRRISPSAVVSCQLIEPTTPEVGSQ
jgi:DNA/RNA-binding domain of Phe-tRNA-synthetase-like protein